jgi:hypothetical protein
MIDAIKKTRSTPSTVKHLDHEMEIIEGPFGRHEAKLMCKQCNKWVMWLPRNYREQLDIAVTQLNTTVKDI